MIYNETSSGGILISGLSNNYYNYFYEGTGYVETFNCSDVSRSYFVSTSYGPGDIAFSRFAALKGVLEKVCIKSVSLNCINGDYNTYGTGCYPIYKDKYNSIWMDENLVNQDQAIILAQAYINRKIAQEEQLLKDCQ